MEFFQELLTDTYSQNYDGIVRIISQKLMALGATVVIQEYKDSGTGKKNVIGIFGKPKLVINCHMDTVPPSGEWETNPLELTEKDGKLFGLGTCDTKGNIYAVLKAIEAIQKEGGKPGNLMLLFSCDEEAGDEHSGVTEFLDSVHAKEIQYAVVCEPTELKFVNKHKGYSSFMITVKAKPGHSSIKAENAIVNAAHLIIELDKAGFNVSNIQGGVRGNITADHCQFKASYRGYDDSRKRLRNIVGHFQGSIDIENRFTGIPFHNEVDFLGLSDGIEVGFWTEAALFQEKGICSLVFGAGSIQQAHAENEYVEKKQIEEAVEKFKNIVEKCGGLK